MSIYDVVSKTINNSLISKTKTGNFLSKLSSSNNVQKLQFPLDIENNQTQTYMIISVNENINNKLASVSLFGSSKLEYSFLKDVKPTKSTIGSGLFGSKSASGTKRTSIDIVLQLPDNALKFNYKNDWEDQQTRSAAIVESIISPLTEMDRKNIIDPLKKAGQNALTNLSGIGRLVHETILGSAGEAIVQTETRQVRNKAVEFLYKAPSPRNFSFKYKLSPKNKNELYAIYNIIKVLKYFSHPENAKGSEGLTYYNIPAEFDIQFFSNGVENKWIHKTSSLGLTGLEENLTGEDGNMSWFENDFDNNGSAPKIVELSLDFKELSILTRTEIEKGF